MNVSHGRLQDILEPAIKALGPNQTFRFGGTQVRRLTPMCIQIERYGSATVTVLMKPVWEVVGVHLVIGGEFTQSDHRLYYVPTFNAIAMKQRFADERLAGTIMRELIGQPCLDCCGSGVVGIHRADDGGPDDVMCLACMGEGVVGRVAQSGFLEFIPY